MRLPTARFGEMLSWAVPCSQSSAEGSLAAIRCSAGASISLHCVGILLQWEPSLGKTLKQVAKSQLHYLLKIKVC